MSLTKTNMKKEGYHTGTDRVYDIALLPKSWYHRLGLKYPLSIKLVSGELMTFENYREHHEFIKKLFKPNEK